MTTSEMRLSSMMMVGVEDDRPDGAVAYCSGRSPRSFGFVMDGNRYVVHYQEGIFDLTTSSFSVTCLEIGHGFSMTCSLSMNMQLSSAGWPNWREQNRVYWLLVDLMGRHKNGLVLLNTKRFMEASCRA